MGTYKYLLLCIISLRIHIIWVLQILKQRSLHYLQKLSWPPTGSCVRYVGKDSRETKTSSSTGEATTFHGSSNRGATKNRGSVSTCARRRPVFITIHRGLWETSQASRNTSAESMERRSGSVRSAPSAMRCSRTGRLIQKLVAPGSTNAIVGLYSQGMLHPSMSIKLNFFIDYCAENGL